jgi:regulatory protein
VEWDADAAWESDPRTAGARPADPSRASSAPDLRWTEADAAGGRDSSRSSRGLPWTDRPTSDADGGGRSGGRSIPRADKPDGGAGESARERRSRGRGKPGRPAQDQRDDKADEQRDPEEVARELCLRLLAVRPRTRAELAAALKKRRIADKVSRAILARYAEVGMIDDKAFAKAWVTSRHHGKGLAGRALAQELRQRGVEQHAVTEALGELDPETEAQTALALAMRKLRTTRGEPDAVFRRLVGMLARKGYSGGVALRAVKEALATRDAELAELIDPDVYED